MFRNAVQIAVGKQSLRQRREGHHTRTIVGSAFQRSVLDLAVVHAVSVLTYKTRNFCLAQNVVAFLLQIERIFRDAHIESLALAYNVDKSLHRLLNRRYAVISVAIEDVEIFKSRTFQTLIDARHQILARRAVAIHALPHLVTSL